MLCDLWILGLCRGKGNSGRRAGGGKGTNNWRLC